MTHPYHISIYLYHDIYLRLEISCEISPRDGTRLQAPWSPKLGQSIFNGEDGRLGVLRPPRGFQPPGRWRSFWHILFDVEKMHVYAHVMGRLKCTYIYIHIYIHVYICICIVYIHVTSCDKHTQIIIRLRLLETEYSTFPRKVGHFRCWFV